MARNSRVSLLMAVIILLFALPLPAKADSQMAPPGDLQGTTMEDRQHVIEEFQKNMQEKMRAKMRDTQRRKIQDQLSGLPPSVLAQQSDEQVVMPSLDEAIKTAEEFARVTALPLIDTEYHKKGKIIEVPDDYKTIQEAINAARSGDTVQVRPGTYYELLVMKDGIKLTSDPSDGGDEFVSVPEAHLQLPKRALRTILDGSHSKPSTHGMIDFEPGVGRKSIIDGFTIQNLPMQNHHIPGHAHGLNVRGASPVIMNCLIQNIGSTGIGSHVVYNDQESPMPSRDFRWDNIKHHASAVLYNNIIRKSVGLGIGCNHFSNPFILGNEVFDNSDQALGEKMSPGMGIKHGAYPTVIGNIVHNNPGSGILSQTGERQGRYGVDRPTHPVIRKNVVYDNKSSRPSIAGQGTGSRETPTVISGNYVFDSSGVGIAVSNGTICIIDDNMVANTKEPGISINFSSALKLNHNKVVNTFNSPGITAVKESVIEEMVGNAVTNENNPRFLIDKSSKVVEPRPAGK